MLEELQAEVYEKEGAKPKRPSKVYHMVGEIDTQVRGSVKNLLMEKTTEENEEVKLPIKRQLSKKQVTFSLLNAGTKLGESTRNSGPRNSHSTLNLE